MLGVCPMRAYVQPSPEIDGWMSQEELQWLFEKAQSVYSVVEIGCWKGRSTHALLSGCPGVVFAVDHFHGSPSEAGLHKEAKNGDLYEKFCKNLSGMRNLIVLRRDSLEAAKLFPPQSIDMVFIDGDHSYEAVKADFLAWSPVAKKILCGHDKLQDGVPRLLKEIKNKVHSGPGEIWYMEKP